MAERIFTIAPGAAFLDVLAEAILCGRLPDGRAAPAPLQLPALTVLLPTRRATRAMQDAFLRAARRRSPGGGIAMLLPRIRPIAETAEDAGLLADVAEAGRGEAGALALPPAMPDLERRLTLMQLVLAWARSLRGSGGDRDPVPGVGVESPAQALAMAADLARLMDMVETEGADFTGLERLVPEDLSEHWQTTVQFLEIVSRYWPDVLAERRLVSPADRRNQALAAEARRIASGAAGPVIVAGVTGSIPATVAVIEAVLSRDDGALVLPGLDRTLDRESWQALSPDDPASVGHPEHPQHGLAKLLRRLGVAREDVRVLGPDGSAATMRARFVSETMRPASTTDRWRTFSAKTNPVEVENAVRGLSLVEAESEREEAEVVALILREAVETPGRTAALVSPDRRLARRVAARLQGFGIEVDDSAGRPFAKTETGSLLELAVAVVAGEFRPADVLAALKHPLARLGLAARDRGFATRALELAAFRTLYLGRGFAGLGAALDATGAGLATRAERFPRAVERLQPDDLARARDLVERIGHVFAPLAELFAAGGAVPFARLVAAHAECAERLAALPPEDGESDLWRGEDGEAAALLITSITQSAAAEIEISPRDYAALWRSLVGAETIRPRAPTHPRVSIWGPFEARLQQADVVVLGSLNEGTWPEAADPGPWLNRPMRRALGLPSPEERLGAAAHDVSMLLAGPRVIMTRALRVENAPTVASRWLLRMRTLLESFGLDRALAAPEPWLAWARTGATPVARPSPKPPAPRPPVALRPRRLSVSDVETWIANPYALYARRILLLEALPPVGRVADASLRGSVLHAAFARFTSEHPAALPEDPAAVLLALTRTILATYTGDPRVAAFWVPRFERICRWFGETEAARRQGVSHTLAEVQGKLSVPNVSPPFLLTARADRVDVTGDGLVLTDYKTGTPPSRKRVEDGFAPQLPLEAAIAALAGLGTLPAGPARRLVYVRATGGEPPGKLVEAVTPGKDVGAIATATLERLARLITTYDDEGQAYSAVRRPGFSYAYDDYAHLGRVAEWLAADVDTGAAVAADDETGT